MYMSAAFRSSAGRAVPRDTVPCGQPVFQLVGAGATKGDARPAASFLHIHVGNLD